MTDARPDMRAIETGAELRRWYWRKAELVELARHHGLNANANKLPLLDRIALFLDTGERRAASPKPRATSKFDWHSAPLTDATIITDSYKNTQNVRRYLKSRLGPGFTFNIAFMEWMRANTGKTLADAITAYKAQKAEAARPGHKTKIKAHNQFNQYTRDILLAHPKMPIEEVRRIWALKIQQPSENGRHIYAPGDLALGERVETP